MSTSSNPAQSTSITQNRLSFGGKTEPGIYVTLYDGDEIVGFTVADGLGNWRAVTDKLADGPHALTATATDLAGNVSVHSPALYVNIAASAGTPANSQIAAPIAVELGFDTDTGPSSTDYVTSVALPVYVGKAKPGSFVELVIDGVKGKFAALADADGNWQARGEVLGEGAHTISVIEHDKDGNTSKPSTAMALTIDTSAPLKPTIVMAPSDDGSSDLAYTSTPAFSGTAEAGARVDLYDWGYFGATKIGSTVADGNGAWSITATPRADGWHRILVEVTDLAGNTADSDVLNITIDTNAPGLDSPSDTGISGDQVTNQAQPSIYGEAAQGTTVVLYEGTQVIGTGTPRADGFWVIVPSKPLADGQHALHAEFTDAQGNALPVSGTLVLTVDTQAPQNVSSKPILDARDDHGSSSSDQVTDATSMVVRGVAAGSNIWLRVYVDGVEQPLKVGVADNGEWAYGLSGLGDGVHRVSVAIEDQAGNVGARSAESIITVDTKAPDAPSTPQLDSLAYATPRLSGTAEAGATVILYDGAVRVGSAVADDKGAWSITSSKLPDGNHNLTATATDLAGNTSKASAVLSVTTDSSLSAPTTLALPGATENGAPGADNLTSLARPVISGTTTPGASVVLYEGKTVIGTGVADANGAWSITPAKALADGEHKLYAQSYDGGGHPLAASATLAVTVDTKAPDAPAVPKLDSLANATPRVTGKVEAGATVKLYDGGALVGSTVADSKGAWSITASKLADGKHSFTVTATDLAGNTSKASAALSVTTDGTADAAPTALDLLAASDKGTSNTDNLTSLATPTITGKAAAGTTVLLFDGATQIGKAIASGSGTWSITSSKLLDGEHHLTAVAQDAAGNLSAASAELLITIDTGLPAVSAPVLDPLSDSGRSQSDGITNVTTPKVSGTAEAGATVTLYEGSTVLGTAVADDKGAWSISSKGLAAGEHKLTAKATDAAGNVSNASAALSITVDVKAPTAPAALDLAASADSGVSNSDNLTSTTAPVVSGKAEANAIVTLYDGVNVLGTATADGSGKWSITSTALADGVHNLTATATDVAGNVSGASTALKLTIDTATAAPLALDLASASDKGASTSDNITNVTTPVITGKAEAGATVVLYDGSTQVGKAIANSSGAWSITTGKLPDAEHHLTAKATDVAGNVSLASDELVFTTDTKAVLVTAAPLLDTLSDSGRSLSDGITNITTPKVSGVTEAGASVALYDGSTLVGSATADNDGNWSITSKTLTTGAHKLTVKVTDIAGNISAASPALALTVDTKGPDAPTTLDLLSIIDSGTSNTDNKTAITTPVISGKAEANAIVALYDGETLLGSALADKSGAWQITSSVSLSTGAHSLTAKATDIAGNVSAASAKLNLTIDPNATGLTLAGTSAADSFLLNSQAGAVKVTGFSAAGGDHLLLGHDYNGLSLNSAADVVALGHVDGKNFVLDFGAGHEVTLVGVTSLAEAAITLIA